MEPSSVPSEGMKWKKKKSKKTFLQKAKKFGKRGQFGRGKQIEKDTYDYFVRVLEQMKAPFEDDEAKSKINSTTIACHLEKTITNHRNMTSSG